MTTANLRRRLEVLEKTAALGLDARTQLDGWLRSLSTDALRVLVRETAPGDDDRHDDAELSPLVQHGMRLMEAAMHSRGGLDG